MPFFTAPRYLPDVSASAVFPDNSRRAHATVPGVLLINLGTAQQPEPRAIRKYLKQFLSDPRVVELPALLWQPVLHAVILPFRPRSLQAKYRAIWHQKGSPLIVHSQAQARQVQKAFEQQGLEVRVVLAMRYGEPTINNAIEQLRQQGCEQILVVPMYPQYAASTTATAVDAVTSYAARLRNQPELRFIKRYHTEPDYIQALERQVRSHWDTHGKPQRLLLSFHGLPRSVIDQGDPYYLDCLQTADCLARSLGEAEGFVQVAFQSRFGAQKWLEPATLPTLQSLARQGCVDVDVICPGFLADCLETLEEIDMQCREAFMAAGGRRFGFISCLNDDPFWGAGFARIIRQHLGGWL